MRQIRLRLFLAFGALLLCPALRGQDSSGIPQLTIKQNGDRVPLAIQDLSLSIEVEGRYAEVVYEAAFLNHTSRRQEGEFVLQLPPETTVSTYALQIGESMRPGVSVEKAKARNAYESIVRRMVDPGLVERENDNRYRTRIFPIEPTFTKRVRIGFIQLLPADGRLEIPLIHDSEIPSLSLSVRGPLQDIRFRNQEKDVDGISDGDTWTATLSEQALNGSLLLHSKRPIPGKPMQRFAVQPDGSGHLLIQGTLARAPEKEKKTLDWSRINLVWDASYSGRWRDHDREFAALSDLCKQIGTGTIALRILARELSAPREFKVTDGTCPALEAHLKTVPFDGAADFSRLPHSKQPTFLFSDGKSSSPIWMPAEGERYDSVFVLTSQVSRIDEGLLEAGLRWVPIDNEDWMAALEEQSFQHRIPDLPPSEWEISIHGHHYICSARIPADRQAPLQLVGPGLPEQPIPIGRASARTETWNLIRRIWAQRRLSTLEWEQNRPAIMDLTVAERLVSEFTSLIVLERFQDHITYRIPPPEPELLVRYREELKEEKINALTRIESSWKRKLEWHGTTFPWIDSELESEVATVSIWVKSSRKAFPPDKLNEDALKPYEEWLPEARAVIRNKGDLSSGQEYLEWKESLEESLGQLSRIRENDPPGEDIPIHVSVRGFVRTKGVYSRQAPFHLQDAIADAGGPNSFGSLGRVFLYRNAQRTGYNLLSPRATNIRLAWGDMVVVENEPSRFHGFSDPFAAPFADPFLSFEPQAYGGAKPAIFESAGARKVKPADITPDRFGVPAESRGDDLDSALSGAIIPFSAPEAEGFDEELVEFLRAHPTPAEHYADLLEGDFGKQPVAVSTTIELARLLFERDEPDLADRVLSNLCELLENPVESTRSLAYWLADMGRETEAVQILAQLLEVAPDEATRALVSFDLGRLSGEARWFRETIEAEIADSSQSPLSTIALTDYYGGGGRQAGSIVSLQRNALPSDLRIVLTVAGGEVEPQFREPVLPRVLETSGKWLARHKRVHEFQIRRAFPGTYQPMLMRWSIDERPVTLHADYYLRWGKGTEQRIRKTYLIESREQSLDQILFDWED